MCLFFIIKYSDMRRSPAAMFDCLQWSTPYIVFFYKQDPHKRNACRVPDALYDLELDDTLLPVTYES